VENYFFLYVTYHYIIHTHNACNSKKNSTNNIIIICLQFVHVERRTSTIKINTIVLVKFFIIIIITFKIIR